MEYVQSSSFLPDLAEGRHRLPVYFVEAHDGVAACIQLVIEPRLPERLEFRCPALWDEPSKYVYAMLPVDDTIGHVRLIEIEPEPLRGLLVREPHGVDDVFPVKRADVIS